MRLDYKKIVQQLQNSEIEKLLIEYDTDDVKVAILCKYKNYQKTRCFECNKFLTFSQIRKLPDKEVFCSVKCMTSSNITKNKIKNTCKEKYGKESFLGLGIQKGLKRSKQQIENRVNSFKRNNHINYDILEDIEKYLGKKNISKKDFDLLLEVCCCSVSVLYRNIKKQNLTLETFRSKGEHEIAEFLDQMNIKYVTNTNLEIYPYQLDIYIPEKKLAIEFNGDYWHQLENKPENYHLVKTELCESKGIRLIHVWESEWSSNKEFIKILITLYLNDKVHQNEFQELLEPFGNRLPRDYFQVLDFSNSKTEKPIAEFLSGFEIKKTGYLAKQ